MNRHIDIDILFQKYVAAMSWIVDELRIKPIQKLPQLLNIKHVEVYSDILIFITIYMNTLYKTVLRPIN